MSFTIFTISIFEYSNKCSKSFEKGLKFVQEPFEWISNFLDKCNLKKLIRGHSMFTSSKAVYLLEVKWPVKVFFSLAVSFL